MERWNAAGLVVLVVVSAVAVAAPLFAPADAAAPPGEVSFDETTFSEQRGDRIYVPITFETGSIAKLSVFGPGYDAELNVRDGDEDGRVVVVINSYRGGDPVEAYQPLDSDDEVGASQLFREVDTLPTGRYDLRLRTDSDRDRASLVIDERRTDGVSVYRAPPTAADSLDSADAVEEAIDSGQVSPLADSGGSTAFVRGDLLVVSVDGTGFAGALTDPRASDLSLRLNRTSDCVAAESLLAGRESDVFVDSERNQYYVVVRTADLSLEPAAGAAGGCDPALTAGDRATVEIRFPPGSALAAGSGENATFGPFGVDERDVALDDPSLDAAANQTVAGSTSLAPGTELSIRLAGDGVDASDTATVTADGRFNATFDLGGTARYANLSLTVAANDRTLANGSRTVVVGADAPAVRISDQRVDADGPAVAVELASLPEGGFVVLEHDGRRLGASSYQDGVVRDLSIPVNDLPSGTASIQAVPYRDSNGNGELDDADRPYSTDGGATSATATVEFPTIETTTTTTTTTTPEPRSTGSGDDLFALVVVALIVGGPVLLAIREA